MIRVTLSVDYAPLPPNQRWAYEQALETIAGLLEIASAPQPVEEVERAQTKEREPVWTQL